MYHRKRFYSRYYRPSYARPRRTYRSRRTSFGAAVRRPAKFLRRTRVGRRVVSACRKAVSKVRQYTEKPASAGSCNAWIRVPKKGHVLACSKDANGVVHRSMFYAKSLKRIIYHFNKYPVEKNLFSHDVHYEGDVGIQQYVALHGQVVPALSGFQPGFNPQQTPMQT